MKPRIISVITMLVLLVCLSPARAQENDDNLATLRAAADAGDARGQFALGNRYLHGQGVQQDYGQALAYFHAAADQGYAPAQNQLGVVFERGLGIPKDYLGAMNYYRQGANQGYAVAQYNVGRLYDAGLGTRVDNQRAFEWFMKAANQGQPDAQDEVGFYYQRGVGAPQIFAWAMDWYQKAAAQGSAQAQNDIGHIYQGGLGVQQDYDQALSWYYKAAEQGNSDAQDNIGYMYEHGLGLEPDFAQAQMWYRRSAGQGNTTAANNLGYMYYKGEGVTPDYGRALAWYQIAANQGHKTAAENIELLRKELQASDSDQWEAANRFAQRFGQELAERIARTKTSAWEAAELELDARQEEYIAAQRNPVAAGGANVIDASKFRTEAQKYRFEEARLRKSLTEFDDRETASSAPSPSSSPASIADGGSPQALPSNDDDPPSRVAQLRYIHGSVSFEPAGTDDWTYPSVNRPMTTGDKLWADQGARAELGTDSAKIRLNGSTGFSFLNLNDHITQVRLTQGSLQIHLRRLDDDESFEVDTPNLALSLLRPGNYRLDVNEAGDTTTVTVAGGQGEVTAGGMAFAVRAGQSGVFSGLDEILQDIEPIQGRDGFDDWCRNQGRREEQAQSARYVSRDVIGYEDLDEYGEWRHSQQYGDVWVPTAVPAGWAPYHNGHWAWVSPWGWTWVDDAPWGFAPFHYGRWAYVNGYWAWCPGPVDAEMVAARPARPVYAPALVAWIGSARPDERNTGGIAWFPLGPREVYVPPYHVSQAYVTNVNVTNTTVTNVNVTNVYNNTTVVNKVTNVANITYVNKTAPGAVTAVPQSAFTSAQPVAKAAVPVDAKQLAVAKVATNNIVVAPQPKSVIGNAAPAVNVPKPPDSTLNRPVVAKVAPPPPPVSFAVQQKIIQQNGGRPVSSAEMQRVQVQQHLAPTANPVVKMAPPVVAQTSQAPGTPAQPRQNDAKPGQPVVSGHSEQRNQGKPVNSSIPLDQAKPATPATPPNGPARDMRAPSVSQPEHANQPQITSIANKSEVKANPPTQVQSPAAQNPAVLQKPVIQKDEARRDQPVSAQPAVSRSQVPAAENKPGDAAKPQNMPPAANDKAKANQQIQNQPAVPESQAPTPKNSVNGSNSPKTPPAANNNSTNSPASAAHAEQQKTISSTPQKGPQKDPPPQQKKQQDKKPDDKKSEKPN